MSGQSPVREDWTLLDHLDHLVLTVADIPTTVDFYTRVLGLEAREFGDGRLALFAPGWKINLHPASAPLKPHADAPTAGSADLCFLLSVSLDDAIATLKQHDVAIELGPVERSGSTDPIMSVYIRDPDQNLIELSEPNPVA